MAGPDIYNYDQSRGVEQLDKTTPILSHQTKNSGAAIRQIAQYLNNQTPVGLNAKLTALDAKLQTLLNWSANTSKAVPLGPTFGGTVVPSIGLFVRDTQFNLYVYDDKLALVPILITPQYRPFFKYEYIADVFVSLGTSQEVTRSDTSLEIRDNMLPKGFLVSVQDMHDAPYGIGSPRRLIPAVYQSGDFSSHMFMVLVPARTSGGLKAVFKSVQDAANTFSFSNFKARVIGVYY